MTRRRATYFVLAVGVVALAALAGYRWLSKGDNEIALRPDDQTYVALGESLYRTSCASCHGAKLEGQPNWRERGPDGLLPAPPHDATGHTWHHPDQVLFNLTKFGVRPFAGPDYRSAMPAFQGRPFDEDILAILSYIKSTWPPEVRQRQDAITEASRKQPHG
jgi:mono/diheme cytochrome c family protein